MATAEIEFRYAVQIGQVTLPDMSLVDAYKTLNRLRHCISGTEMKLIRLEG